MESARPAVRGADTLYFGGGTPSLVPPARIGELIDQARHSSLVVAKGAEVSLEANPKDLDGHGYEALLRAGVNRLSLGLQSFDDDVLREMDRRHSADDGRRAFREARKAGFENLSVDLILGWPGETRERFLGAVREAINLGPEHLSLYILETDGKTVVAYRERRGTLNAPDDDLVADLFLESEDLLVAAGLVAYEISNYARPGFESRHNLKYWNDAPFLAFGMSAHGYVDGRRSWNEATYGAYCVAMETRGNALAGERLLTPEERIREAAMTGLRKRAGIDRSLFATRYRVDVIDRFGDDLASCREAGLLDITSDRVALTRRGVLLSNEVFAAFL
jgi:oxygen-independent coproporphyrinogen-3 oxidase